MAQETQQQLQTLVKEWEAKYGEDNVGPIKARVSADGGMRRVWIRKPDREVIFHFQAQKTNQESKDVLIANCVLRESDQQACKAYPDLYESVSAALSQIILKTVNRMPEVVELADGGVEMRVGDYKVPVSYPKLAVYNRFLDMRAKHADRAIGDLLQELIPAKELKQVLANDDLYFAIYKGVRERLFPIEEYDLGKF